MTGAAKREPTTIVGPSHKPEGDALSGVDRQLAIEEIRLTKARYCAAVDDHDWQVLRFGLHG